jgi:2-polyprenyl-3-methyl-5-hydroxy-6-metoxy-1,4-benzoquinol methylase
MDMDETKLFYDLVAEHTADEWYPNTVLLPSIEEFVSSLPEKPRILDLGCGPGYESMRLASAGADVVGIDFSSENIRIARERCPQCKFIELDFRHLDNGLGRFDGVFACASLIHITPLALPGVLKKVAEILNPVGKLLAIVRNGSGIREHWPIINGHKVHRVVQLYSQAELRRLAAPFQLVREGYLATELKEQGWRSYLFEVLER